MTHQNLAVARSFWGILRNQQKQTKTWRTNSLHQETKKVKKGPVGAMLWDVSSWQSSWLSGETGRRPLGEDGLWQPLNVAMEMWETPSKTLKSDHLGIAMLWWFWVYDWVCHISCVVLLRANTSSCPRFSAVIFVCAESVVKMCVFTHHG